MINSHEINFPLDPVTMVKIEALAGLTEETFDDDKGHLVLAGDIIRKTVGRMHTSNIWRTFDYVADGFVLQTQRHLRRDLVDLTISKRGDQEHPATRIVFNRNSHRIKRVERLVSLDVMGVKQNVTKRMWPPERRQAR